MKKCLLTVVIFACMVSATKAQDDKDHKNKSLLAVGLGASANYYYGPGDENFGTFNNDRLNWFVNGMFGLVIGRDNDGRRSMIAAFGNVGFNKAATITQMLKDQSYVTSALNQDNTNNAFQLEGGLMIMDVLRVSTGVGQQNFANQTLGSTNGNGIKLNAKSLQYNSSTVGLNLKFSLVTFSVNVNFNYGKDYNKTVLNPYAGIMLNL